MTAHAAAIRTLQDKLYNINGALEENERGGAYYHRQSQHYRDAATVLNVEKIEITNAIVALGGTVPEEVQP